jgi:hypothetical protein
MKWAFKFPVAVRYANYLFFIALLCSIQSCKKLGTARTAFYYWKSGFSLNAQQAQLFKETGHNNIYLRFFDIVWDDRQHRALPNAVVKFNQPPSQLNITPVVFIANKTFEMVKDNAIDSLATNSNALINRIAHRAGISYKNVQFDCDWTLSTREKYFDFLQKFKQVSHLKLEATIRLHQVKYKERTGVPPVDKGVLMFYNMGTLNANLQQPNSIYNEADAAKYVSYLPQYPLVLDVALPLFSWSIHIREGKIIQLYTNPRKSQFADTQNFSPDGNAYRAKKSFFSDGIYIKENDIFKLEETDVNTLKTAAKQLSHSHYLPSQKNRTIIYYELGNLNQTEFTAETLRQVSADL